MDRSWLQRFAKLAGAGIVVAIAVTETVLGLGFDLIDAPFFQAPGEALGLAAAALGFAAFQARPGARPAGMMASLVAFGVVVLPFNALGDKPAMPIEYWKGTAGLLVDRTMTVDRPHKVVLLIKGAQMVGKSGLPAAPPTDIGGAESIVGRLFGDPRDTFAVAPEGNQSRPISPTEDMRWAWTVTPRQPGPHRLVLELDTLGKGGAKAGSARDKASNIFRQLIIVRVLPPSWYEQGRTWLLGRS